jgi:hypothetical protein
VPCCFAAAGEEDAQDLREVVAQLRAELAKVQAQAAEREQANLTLGAELSVLERKQRNQVCCCWCWWPCVGNSRLMP